MRLSNNFKIRKFIERNCKTLCIYDFFFFFGQYMKLIFYNLILLMITLKKISKNTTAYRLNFLGNYMYVGRITITRTHRD